MTGNTSWYVGTERGFEGTFTLLEKCQTITPLPPALVLYFPFYLSMCVSLSSSPVLLTAPVWGSAHLWVHSRNNCYLFFSDQPFITHTEGWLWKGELPGLVAGFLDLSISLSPPGSLSCFLPFVFSLAHTPAHSSIYHLLTPLLYLLHSLEFTHLLQLLIRSPVNDCLFSHQSPDYLW